MRSCWAAMAQAELAQPLAGQATGLAPTADRLAREPAVAPTQPERAHVDDDAEQPSADFRPSSGELQDEAATAQLLASVTQAEDAQPLAGQPSGRSAEAEQLRGAAPGPERSSAQPGAGSAQQQANNPAASAGSPEAASQAQPAGRQQPPEGQDYGPLGGPLGGHVPLLLDSADLGEVDSGRRPYLLPLALSPGSPSAMPE